MEELGCPEAMPRTWMMKPELHCSGVGVPVGALSPPATLSPPSSPCVMPASPWSPGGPGSSSSSSGGSALVSLNPTNPPIPSAGGAQLPPDHRLSAFSFVSGYNNSDHRLQKLPLGSGPSGPTGARGSFSHR